MGAEGGPGGGAGGAEGAGGGAGLGAPGAVIGGGPGGGRGDGVVADDGLKPAGGDMMDPPRIPRVLSPITGKCPGGGPTLGADATGGEAALTFWDIPGGGPGGGPGGVEGFSCTS